MNIKTKIISKIIILIFILSIAFSMVGASDVPLREKFSYGMDGGTREDYYRTMNYPYYEFVLKEYDERRAEPALTSPMFIDVINTRLPSGNSPDDEHIVIIDDRSGFNWKEDVEYLEWEFDIIVAGLYQIEIEYYMPTGSASPTSRALTVDGRVPFIEANTITFNSLWKDAGEPTINSIGDETRPKQIQTLRWNKKDLQDGSGLYSEPFKFYFEPGNHTVRLEYIDQQIIIGQICIKPAERLPEYTEIKDEYIKAGHKSAISEIEFQAESTILEKNDPILRRESDGDPKCKPVSYKTRRLNVMGGWRWRNGNQSITWEFDAPETGLYKIGLRVAQVWNDGLPSFRQIAIDDKVPFKEMSEYKFKYDSKWRTETLQDSSGEPYLFYLEKGSHTITMTIKLGQLTQVINSLNSDTIMLSNMIRDIMKITGGQPDPNYDYEFFKTNPDLCVQMQELADSLQKNYDIVKGMADKTPAMANNFLTIKRQLESMIKNPFSIAARLDDINNALASLSTWYMGLQEQPLLIDYFLLGGQDTKWEANQSNLLQKLKFTIANFLSSFTKNYDNVGSILSDDIEIDKVINVWIARGTEWAEMVKEMADEDFTPETGIMVNMNIIPPGQLDAGGINVLMLSIASGEAPDVALGVAAGSPVEFAIRDAVYDLSKFETFEEVKKRFIPNIFIPYEYDGGIYALPETMNFMVMFYRKDIIQELGVKLPDSREEIYNYLLPLLYQNGLEFFYPADFTQFIFQHGASYYSDNGKRTGLDTPAAYRAIKECSELFTNYGIPVAANFFNRFRTGEMPIGIADYGMYMTLSVAAPEIAGRWAVAPLPGLLKPDGSIDRSNGGLAVQCDIILKNSKHPQESWDFLDWWMSTPIQTRYAREIEALVGAEARWNTANLEAFSSLSWNRQDLEVILEQFEWSRDIPIVLGGYFTNRILGNAWNKIIINGESVRDALETAVEDINKELKMRQEGLMY